MTLQFIVVDNTNIRTRNLTRVGRDIKAKATIAQINELDGAITTAGEISDWTAEDLAQVDACFVDFDLDTRTVPGHEGWPQISLDNGRLHVQPYTGMTTLLYLRDILGSDAYRDARAAWLNAHPANRAWTGRAGTMRLFTFVEASHTVSKIFAAAAHSWFGATYLNAQANIGDLTMYLQDPASYIDKFHMVAKIRVAGEQLDAILFDTDFFGNTQIIPQQHRPSNYDLFRIYLAHRGKAGYGVDADARGFRDAVFDVTGVRPAGTFRSWQWAVVLDRVQFAWYGFRAAFISKPDTWPAWKLNDHDDPLYDILDQSRLFWTAPDVQLAVAEQARRRNAMR